MRNKVNSWNKVFISQHSERCLRGVSREMIQQKRVGRKHHGSTDRKRKTYPSRKNGYIRVTTKLERTMNTRGTRELEIR